MCVDETLRCRYENSENGTPVRCARQALALSPFCGYHLPAEQVAGWQEAVVIEKGRMLRSANLDLAPLSFLDLGGANLSGANLDNAVLYQTILSNADLSNSYLRNATLSEANFENANLESANLSNSNLKKSKLNNANLKFANLVKADLSESQLKHAVLESSNFTDATLEKCNLSEANMRDANFTSANLKNSILKYADLYGINLTDAHLNSSVLDGADLTFADLTGTDLREIEYIKQIRIPLPIQRIFLRLHFLNIKEAGYQFIKYCFATIAIIIAPFIIALLFQKICFELLPICVILPIWPFATLLYRIYHFPYFELPDMTLSEHIEKVKSQGRYFNPYRPQKDWPMYWYYKLYFYTRWRSAALDSVGRCDPSDLQYFKNQSYLEAQLEKERKYNATPYDSAWMYLWGITSGYGQYIWLWIFWSAFLVISFALTYYMGSVGESNYLLALTNDKVNWTWFTPLYFSVVTFSTLGFGDVAPKSDFGQIIVTAEVILGYVMLGGLISIFSTKLARLSD